MIKADKINKQDIERLGVGVVNNSQRSITLDQYVHQKFDKSDILVSESLENPNSKYIQTGEDHVFGLFDKKINLETIDKEVVADILVETKKEEYSIPGSFLTFKSSSDICAEFLNSSSDSD